VANHPSALKRNRQRLKRTERNRRYKTSVRSFVKRLRKAIDAKDVPAARQALPETVRALDRAAVRGVFQKRTVSRTIARLTRAVNGLA
jgi:small subunit ribosomal protein S20